MTAPEPATPQTEAAVLQLDGRVLIAQSDTDPGDMGEPRVFTADDVTYVTVPSFAFWDRAAPADRIDVARLGRAFATVQGRVTDEHPDWSIVEVAAEYDILRGSR